MTKSELRTRVQEALNDTTGVHWTTSQIDRALLEAAETLVEETRAIRRSTLVPLMEGASYYYLQALAPDLLFPYRIWTARDERKLTALSLKELDAYHQEWDTVTGDPELWCPLSWDVFVLWPRIANGGNLLRVDYIAWPQDDLGDEDMWDVPEQSQDTLLHYALYDLSLQYYDLDNAQGNLQIFAQQFDAAQSRSGVRKVQAREFGREPFPRLVISSGIR